MVLCIYLLCIIMFENCKERQSLLKGSALHWSELCLRNRISCLIYSNYVKPNQTFLSHTPSFAPCPAGSRVTAAFVSLHHHTCFYFFKPRPSVDGRIVLLIQIFGMWLVCVYWSHFITALCLATAHMCLYGDMDPSEIYLDRNMLLGAYCNKTFPLMSALRLPSRKLSMTLLHTHHSLTKRVWVPRLITSDLHPKQQWRGHAPPKPLPLPASTRSMWRWVCSLLRTRRDPHKVTLFCSFFRE